MRFLPALLLVLTGCAGKNEPVVAHGKPAAHSREALKQPDSKAHKKAVGALGLIGAADPDAIPGLIDALKDADPAVRDAAVLALLNLGPDAKDAVPALNQARSDKNATVRAHAEKALQQIQSGP